MAGHALTSGGIWSSRRYGEFLLVLAGFLDVPLAGLGWEIGAYLAVAAAALATLPAALAVRRSRPRR